MIDEYFVFSVIIAFVFAIGLIVNILTEEKNE